MKKLLITFVCFCSILTIAINHGWIPEPKPIRTGLRMPTNHVYTYSQNETIYLDNNVLGWVPGDVITLTPGEGVTQIRALELQNFQWNGTDSFKFRIAAGTQLVINAQSFQVGDPFASFIKLENCRGVSLYPEDSTKPIKIYGSTSSTRANCVNIHIWGLSDAITIKNVDARDGGTGVQIKCEVTTDPATRDGATVLSGYHLRNIKIRNAKNEGFYLGSTWIKYSPTGGGSAFIGSWNASDPGPGYYFPLVHRNLQVINCSVDTSGNDGFQIANFDTVLLRYCMVSEHAFNYYLDPDSPSGHKGGILIGGRTKNTTVKDCIVWPSSKGHGVWHYGEGPNHVVENVLVYNLADGELINLRGGKWQENNNDFFVHFKNCTFAKMPAWGVGVRVNGIMGATTAPLFTNCVIAEPGDGGFGGFPNNPRYFYAEDNGSITGIEGTGGDANKKFNTVAAADVDVNNYLLPNSESSIGDEGFHFWGSSTPPPTPPVQTKRQFLILKRKQ